METPRVWLITGASSGFGRSPAEFALSKGDFVVATLRKPEVLAALVATYSEERLLVLRVDVCKQADIDRAFAQTREKFGRIDVVFNNAGHAISGDAESTPIESAHALFDVNFWGAVNVCIIEPGGFKTQVASNTMNHPLHRAHETDSAAAVAFRTAMAVSSDQMFPGDANKFAKAIYALVEGGNIPLHLPLGQDALGIAGDKIKVLNKAISDGATWSTGLRRDELGKQKHFSTQAVTISRKPLTVLKTRLSCTP